MAVACGVVHTLVVGEGGATVFAFGHGQGGRLGTGTTLYHSTPTTVLGLPADVVAVAGGGAHSAAVTADGRLLLWGYNHYGQLGQGDREDRLQPAALTRLPGLQAVRMVACGGDHTLVVTRTGALFAFGDGFHGQLGLGSTSNIDLPAEVRINGAVVTHAACGEIHSIAVSESGSVWTWGCKNHGKLGHGDVEGGLLLPKRVEGDFGMAVAAAAGAAHTVVLTTCGQVWACGYGNNGQLGVGDTVDRHALTRAAPTGCTFKAVACGYCHTLALSDTGEVWSWGRGDGGMLGHNDTDDRMVPTQVYFGGTEIVVVGCGGSHSAAVSATGDLFTWGTGKFPPVVYGILGHGDEHDKLVPSVVPPERLLGQRIGRGLPLAPRFLLAFAMCTHARLGVASPVWVLAGELGLSRMIAEFAGDYLPDLARA